MSVRRLPSGRWQAVVNLSLGTCMHKEEAEALVHAHQQSEASPCMHPRGQTAPCMHIGDTTLEKLQRIRDELKVDSLEAVVDYLVDNCWEYA